MAKKKIVEKKVEEKPVKKSQIKSENRIMIGMISAMVALILIIAGFVIYVNSKNEFDYRGTEFTIVKEKDLVFYETSFPVIFQGERRNYSIYLRNDPRELEKEVPFEGELNLEDAVFLNGTTNPVYECEDAMIAIANFAKMEVFDVELRRDPAAVCDPQGRYTFIDMRPGNETSVREYAPNCYNIRINNCEIVKGTERFLVESFVRVNEELGRAN